MGEGGLAGAFRCSEESLPHPHTEGQTGLRSGLGECRVLGVGEARDGGAGARVVGFGAAGSRGHTDRLPHTESSGDPLMAVTLAHTISPMTTTAAVPAGLYAEVASRVIASGVEVTDENIYAELVSTLADRQAFLDKLHASYPFRMQVAKGMADAIYPKYGRDAA